MLGIVARLAEIWLSETRILDLPYGIDSFCTFAGSHVGAHLGAAIESLSNTHPGIEVWLFWALARLAEIWLSEAKFLDLLLWY